MDNKNFPPLNFSVIDSSARVDRGSRGPARGFQPRVGERN
jgi:hypothetical protein